MYRCVTETKEERRERCRRSAHAPKKPYSQWDTKLSPEEKAKLAGRGGSASKGVTRNLGNSHAAGPRSLEFRKACQARALKQATQISSFKKNGRFTGTKTQAIGVWYDSGYELDFLRACEGIDDVINVQRAGVSIPYFWNGLDRIYLPDFLVHTTSGITCLVEVKPKKQVNWTRNVLKTQAAQKFVVEHNWVFLVVTECDIRSMLISNEAGRKSSFLVGRNAQRLEARGSSTSNCLHERPATSSEVDEIVPHSGESRSSQDKEPGQKEMTTAKPTARCLRLICNSRWPQLRPGPTSSVPAGPSRLPQFAEAPALVTKQQAPGELLES